MSDSGEKQPEIKAFSVPKTITKNGHTIVLVPQPSDNPNDPLNWPMYKKCLVYASVTMAAFACQMSPNSNMLVFVNQIPTYGVSLNDMLNSVAAALAGWTIGPFLIIPLVSYIGRSAVIMWSLLAILGAQIWAAKMTGPDDYVSFVISRMFAGLFGAIPVILGSGYIIDLFYLHQRGKAFAVFEITIIFAVIGGGTLGGFVTEGHFWDVVFWWTLGPIGLGIILTLLFVEDTSYNRDPSNTNIPAPLPESWVANRVATFLPGTRTQPPAGKNKDFIKRLVLPVQIAFTPVLILVGLYVMIFFGLAVMQASTLAAYLQPPEEAGGYGFSSLQLAFFTMTAWVGIGCAEVCGFLFNDKVPLWVARQRGGQWHPEYRLANAIIPSFTLPIGLGLWGAGLQYHLHYMVLALASFIIWFSALAALPVCCNYIVECFVHNPIECTVSINFYRILFGLITVFITTQWEHAVGIGWVWGMGAFFIVFVDILMIGMVFKGHVVREYTTKMNKTFIDSEDGAVLNIKADDASV